MTSRLELQSGESAIFGYGSLLWQPSMERTLGRPYRGRPVAAQLPGWRRVWDVLMPNRTFYFIREDGGHCVPEHIAYLNIRPGNFAVNGLVYAVTPTDLAAFDAREEPYDRLDVSASVVGIEVVGGPVFVYVGKANRLQRWPEPKERVAVRATYLEIVENGLRTLGPDFREAYERSTDDPPAGNIIGDRQHDMRAR